MLSQDHLRLIFSPRSRGGLNINKIFEWTKKSLSESLFCSKYIEKLSDPKEHSWSLRSTLSELLAVLRRNSAKTRKFRQNVQNIKKTSICRKEIQ